MRKRLTLKDHQFEAKLFLRRTLLVGLIVLLLSGGLVARLIYLQVDQHHRYTTLSDLNQLELIPIKPNRGLITDRNGVLLADNVAVFNLELTRERMKNFDKTIKKLREIITITDDDIEAYHKQARQRRSFEPVPLKLKLTEEERARFAVNQYKFPGVSVKARLIRHYPFGASLAHVLGYVSRINENELRQVDPVNYSATNFIGKLGIEKYYEKELHGSVGYERVEIDASGHIVRVMHRTPPRPGNKLKLTIDIKLQQEIEHALGSHRGAVVAINPQNGDVLALVSTPTYDPNLFVKGISSKDYSQLRDAKGKPLYNRAIRGLYPLASTIKPFLAVAGLESGKITPGFRIRDPGWFKLPFSSHVYKDWKKTGHGTVDVGRAIKVSCDTFFYTLANRMGISRIYHFLTQFGFGKLTQIDMHEELPGLVPNPQWKRRVKGKPWYPGDTIISGIGQGFMLTTPLQLASATATLSMRGINHKPHLLLSQEPPGGMPEKYLSKPEVALKLKRKRAWGQVIKAMRRVITEAGGTGYRFGRDAPYSVAAKTGTGQVFSAKFHAPFDDADLPEHLRDHSLFVAFAPMDKPTIAIGVVVENSKIASNVARTTMDYYFLHKTHNHKTRPPAEIEFVPPS